MQENMLSQRTLKEIVTEDFRTAAVFEQHALDFCCRGGNTVEAACREKGIDPAQVLKELLTLGTAGDRDAERTDHWQPDILAEHIVQRHHSYVRRMIPVLYAHTQKVASVHGTNHPETIRIAEAFAAVAQELQHHMMKEEQLLFPYITLMFQASLKGATIQRAPFGTVQNPIRMMEEEHRNAGDEMALIRALSNTYTPPEDACTTYRITFQELKEFEADLHRHIHLENNVLFPMALRLEESINATLQRSEAQ